MVMLEQHWYCDYYSAARVIDSIDDIEEAVMDAIAHPEKNRERRKKAVNHRGIIEGDEPKESIVRIVKQKICEFRERKEINDNKR